MTANSISSLATPVHRGERPELVALAGVVSARRSADFLQLPVARASRR